MPHDPSFIKQQGLWRIHMCDNFGGPILLVTLRSPTNIIFAYGLWDKETKTLSHISLSHQKVLKDLLKIVGKELENNLEVFPL